MDTKRQVVNEHITSSQTELVPLVDKLYTDFSIEVLEERLETDPLMLSGLFDEITPYCLQCKKSELNDCSTNCAQCNRASYSDPCNCNSVNMDVECFKF